MEYLSISDELWFNSHSNISTAFININFLPPFAPAIHQHKLYASINLCLIFMTEI